MNTKSRSVSLALVLLALFTLNSRVANALAQGTAFTYQGQLTSGSGPASGSYDLQFTLYATNTGGVAIAGPVLNSATSVANGLFATTINFGPGVFTGGSNWLDIAVRATGTGTFTELTPRQPVTPVPYAIFATGASNVLGTVAASQVTGSLPASQLSGPLSLGQLPAEVVTNNETSLMVATETLSGRLTLPSPTATIYSGSSILLDSYATGNFGAGLSALTVNSGEYNTAVGDNALFQNTAGANNTAVGYQAMLDSVSGSFNTAVGYQALGYGIDGTGGNGSYNTAVGNQALYGETTGANNTAIGGSALKGVAAGGNNTAVGFNAMSSQNGNNNTASGDYVMANGTGAGNDNVANGYKAMYDNITGSYNTVNGLEALYSSTTGNFNLAEGFQALENLIGGSNNIALGSSAGSVLTNGNNNIYLGTPGTTNAENFVIRIGTPGIQTNTVIAGVINGNGAGLTNLNFSASNLPGGVVTNNEADVTLGNLNVSGSLYLAPAGDIIYSGNQTILYSDNYNNLYAGIGAGNGGNGFNGEDNTVFGDGSLSFNTSGIFNSALGVNALYHNTSGSDNAANGSDALSDNTSGSQNTASGFAALGSNTVGQNNTANGFYTLSANTNGNYNTADGAQALLSDQAGSYNSAFGDDAMKFAMASDGVAMGYEAMEYTTNGNNVAVGYQAMKYSTNESEEVAIGYQALQYDNAGGRGESSVSGENTAIGYQALQANLTGADNTAIGYHAFLDNQAGSASTANGAYALASSTTGFGNTAIGYGTLSSLTSGGGNTAIGALALANLGYVSGAGINNIALGSSAGYNLESSESDNIDVGSSGVTGESGIIRIGDPASQTTAYIAGNVGLGGATPQQTLSLNGGVNIDQAGQNVGTVANALTFGSTSGEGIGSKRTSGGTQFDLDFYTGSQKRMTILSNGNVGIGTNNPVAQLDVAAPSYGAPALNIARGALKVAGAGLNTDTTAFIQVTTAGNLGGDSSDWTEINNPICNNNPNAILIITFNFGIMHFANAGVFGK